jgi:hypothetical protein
VQPFLMSVCTATMFRNCPLLLSRTVLHPHTRKMDICKHLYSITPFFAFIYVMDRSCRIPVHYTNFKLLSHTSDGLSTVVFSICGLCTLYSCITHSALYERAYVQEFQQFYYKLQVFIPILPFVNFYTMLIAPRPGDEQH